MTVWSQHSHNILIYIYICVCVNICTHLCLPRHEPANFCPSTFANKKASNRISNCTWGFANEQHQRGMKWSNLKVQTEYCKQEPLFDNTMKQHKATFQKKTLSVLKNNDSSFTKHVCCCHRNYYWLPVANKWDIETGTMQEGIRGEKCKEWEPMNTFRTRKMTQSNSRLKSLF